MIQLVLAGALGLPFNDAQERPVEAGGLIGREWPSTPRVEQAAEQLSDRDRAVHALTVAFDPAALREVLADPLRRRVWAHDLLFAANPDTADSTKWDPSYRNWDGRTQTLIVSPLEKSAALRAFSRIAETHRHAAGREDRRPWVALLVEQLCATPGKTLFEAHWDNKDDTAFDGLIAIDVSTGLVRVLMSNDFA
jgi:hypothetical protein